MKVLRFIGALCLLPFLPLLILVAIIWSLVDPRARKTLEKV